MTLIFSFGLVFQLPVVTTLGMVFSSMLGSSVIVEKVFGWKPKEMIGRGKQRLFRSGPENRALIQDDVNATASVIRHTFIDLGMSRVLEGCPGFINVNERLLKSPVLDLLPPESIILEILESVPLDDSVRERCRELQARGYRLALDDVSDITPEIQAMLPLVSYLKIDLQQVSLALLPESTKPLRERLPGITDVSMLIA